MMLDRMFPRIPGISGNEPITEVLSTQDKLARMVEQAFVSPSLDDKVCVFFHDHDFQGNFHAGKYLIIQQGVGYLPTDDDFIDRLYREWRYTYISERN